MRPDGSERRNITNTADYEEGGPRFSPDGKQLLYRRFAKGTVINHDLWGFQGNLMIAEPDGSNPVQIGGDREFPWASWSPDGKQIACLTRRGSRSLISRRRRSCGRCLDKGIYQQLFWSPDGQWFCGVANARIMWTVVRMNARDGRSEHRAGVPELHARLVPRLPAHHLSVPARGPGWLRLHAALDERRRRQGSQDDLRRGWLSHLRRGALAGRQVRAVHPLRPTTAAARRSPGPRSA